MAAESVAFDGRVGRARHDRPKPAETVLAVAANAVMRSVQQTTYETSSPFLPYGLFRGKRVLRKVAEPSQGRQTQDLFSQ